METIKNVAVGLAELALTGLMGIAIFAAFVYCLSLGFTTIGGLLFGFGQFTPVCNAYFSKTITVGEMLIAPVTPYACQPNAGLLTKASSAVGTYLDKPWYKKETK